MDDHFKQVFSQFPLKRVSPVTAGLISDVVASQTAVQLLLLTT
jgi:hypothetical protein